MTFGLLVPVAAKDLEDVVAVLDFEDFIRLEGRKLSLGSHGYAQMWDEKLMTLVYRWVVGAKPRDGRIVDHLNGDRLDDRRLNLRFVTAAESSANVKARGVSGFRGVYPMRGKWQAKGKRAAGSTISGHMARPRKRPRSRTCGGLKTYPATRAGTSLLSSNPVLGLQHVVGT